ncbi:prolyl aminopeptidase [Rhizorhabdus wittichii]|uniref:Proline iminopeptidase n=1 Tax=Rhizorhabdus wittichii TaxID=160791 RepID=A0A975HC89_9SPHN|nr:prolyl aminopeptidase [Rhizorhabdus wittichii]QTH20190.1 prolyl aminopeptidase [Rhizorhabdus wittichii]
MPLFPAIDPYDSGYLPVGGGHSLYVEQSGNPRGAPVVCVHGGPGGGSQPSTRRFFDPRKFRIILYDQRGAGRSRWSDLLAGNQTSELVGDLRRLRNALGLDRWMVFAGSWGTALAMAYAQRWPAEVTGMVLRGVFLARRRDIDWLYKSDGASRYYPALWRELVQVLGGEDGGRNLASRFERHLSASDRRVRLAAAGVADRWAATLGQPCTMWRKPALHRPAPTDALVEQMRLKFHYFARDCFIGPLSLAGGLYRLAGIPAFIVNGEVDAVCPVQSARLVHREWRGSELEIVSGGGHSPDLPVMADALVRAVARCAAAGEAR